MIIFLQDLSKLFYQNPYIHKDGKKKTDGKLMRVVAPRVFTIFKEEFPIIPLNEERNQFSHYVLQEYCPFWLIPKSVEEMNQLERKQFMEQFPITGQEENRRNQELQEQIAFFAIRRQLKVTWKDFQQQAQMQTKENNHRNDKKESSLLREHYSKESPRRSSGTQSFSPLQDRNQHQKIKNGGKHPMQHDFVENITK